MTLAGPTCPVPSAFTSGRAPDGLGPGRHWSSRHRPPEELVRGRWTRSAVVVSGPAIRCTSRGWNMAGWAAISRRRRTGAQAPWRPHGSARTSPGLPFQSAPCDRNGVRAQAWGRTAPRPARTGHTSSGHAAPSAARGRPNGATPAHPGSSPRSRTPRTRSCPASAARPGPSPCGGRGRRGERRAGTRPSTRDAARVAGPGHAGTACCTRRRREARRVRRPPTAGLASAGLFALVDDGAFSAVCEGFVATEMVEEDGGVDAFACGNGPPVVGVL